MIVKNPNNLPTINIRKVNRLQKDLKIIKKKNALKLKASIEKHGFFIPIFLWKRPKGQPALLDGHTRKFTIEKWNMDRDGKDEVPYILIEADNVADAKEKLLKISSQYANITQEGYDKFTLDLPDIAGMVSFDGLPLLGIDTEKATPKEVTPPDVADGPAKSQLGKVYKLGRHRLLCGDALDDAEILMGGGLANMVFTDPPWNVAIGLDSNPKHRQRKGLDNDNLSAEDFEDFINNMSGVYAKYCKGDFYCVLGTREWPTLDKGLRNNGFRWSGTIIWVKDTFVLGRSKYHRRFEPIWYGWHEQGKSSYNGSRKEDDVWEVPRPRVSKDHPTMKPIELCAKAIENSSKEGDIVLDLFGGSGSTLMACEQLDRTCYTAEIDPRYADVIRKRYWKFVNKDEKGWEKGTPEV